MTKDVSDAEASAIGSPDVTKVGGSYAMVYAQGCRTAASPTEARHNQGKIGLAYSPDGVSWSKKGSVLAPAPAGQWDDWFLDTPCVVIKDGKAYLYYFGDTDNAPGGGAIGLAVSSDMITWTRVGAAPVLSPGTGEAWDSNWVESPSVRYDEKSGLFHLWYTGVDKSWIVRTGHATSADGISWKKDSANPVLRERNIGFTDLDVWDGSGAGVAASFVLDGTFHLFYASQSANDTLAKKRNPQIGLATSADGSAFTRYSDLPVLTRPAVGSPVNGPYNPSVLYEEGVWKVWYETAGGFSLATMKLK
jgi:predicted GH43/DUF377 family glycosyl hydrolase